MVYMQKDNDNIVRVNGKYVEVLGDLVSSLNSKTIEIEVPIEEGRKYIKALEKLSELQDMRTLELNNSIKSNKYIKPIIDVYCKNATVRYLNTIVSKIDDNYLKITDTESIKAIINRRYETKINEEDLRIKISIYLSNPTIVEYKDKNEQSNIIIESISSGNNFMLLPKYKFRYDIKI